MHIGIVRDTYFTNEPRGLNIARVLITNGFKVSILCFGDLNTVETKNKITFVRFHLNNKIKRKISSLIETIPVYKYLWAYKIKQFIINHEIDVLQVHDLYMLGPAIMANRKFKLPVVANFHENYPAAIKSYNWANSLFGKILVRPKIWETLEGKYLSKVSKLILLSESFRDLLLKKYALLNAHDIIVYPNVPDLTEFEGYPIDKTIYQKKNEFILFYFGVVAERRGFIIMFEALKLLLEHKNIKLMIIGPVDHADKNNFFSYLKSPDLKERIIYKEWIEIKFLPSYIFVSDICLSPILKNPQHDSGVANKVFQYMLLGKPLVVSDSSEQKRIVEQNKCGLVHEHDNPQDMVNKILQLYNNPTLCENMANSGKEAVIKTYNSVEQSKKIIQMYKELEGDLR